MPFDLATSSAAGISLQLVPGFGLFGKRMRHEAAPVRLVQPATEAEALSTALIDAGASVFVTVPPEGRTFLTFGFSTFPAAPVASSTAALIRHRFDTDEQFRKDLFAVLLEEGRVLQHLGYPNPLPRPEGLGTPASPALASNR